MEKIILDNYLESIKNGNEVDQAQVMKLKQIIEQRQQINYQQHTTNLAINFGFLVIFIFWCYLLARISKKLRGWAWGYLINTFWTTFLSLSIKRCFLGIFLDSVSSEYFFNNCKCSIFITN